MSHNRCATIFLASLLATAPAFAQDAPRRIRIGGAVAQAQLVNQVRPTYPPLARQARIQGTVRLQVILSRDGKVAQLEAISGHPLLQGSAMEAVKQWEYNPTLLNGEAVEVVTTVDVVFTLSDGPATSAKPSQPTVTLLKPDRAELVKYVEPEYSVENLVRGARGKITLEVTLDADGRVVDVTTEDGGWEFSEAAEAAVKQWVFAPNPKHEKNEPVPVHLVFEVPEVSQAQRLVTEAAEKAIAANPQDAKPYYHLGLVAKNQALFTEAVAKFRQALSLDPTLESARAELLILLENVLHDPEALALELRAGADRHPNDSSYRGRLAELQLKLGDADSAIAEYEQLRRAFPDEEWCASLAEALYRKNPQTARDAVRRLAAECGEAADFHASVASSLSSRMQLTTAMVHYEEALRLRPDFEGLREQVNSFRQIRDGATCVQQQLATVKPQDPRFLGATLSLALAEFVLTEDLEKGLAKLRPALREREVPTAVYVALSELFTRMRGWDFSIAEMQRLIALRPASAGAHAALGWTLLNRGRIEEALNAGRHALSLDSKEVMGRAVIAGALIARGKNAEANEELKAGGLLNSQAALRQLQEPLMQVMQGIEEMVRGCSPEGDKAQDPMLAAETVAVGSLRTLNTANVAYHAAYGGFPLSLAHLGPAENRSETAADLIDPSLASGTRNGYNFIYSAERTDEKGKVVAYTLHAEPTEPGKTGKRYFFTDQSGVIRFEVMGRASVNSPPVQ